MKKRPALGRLATALLCTLSVLAPSAALSATRKNKDYNPAAAASFPFVTTGVAFKITGANIAKDGTITARVTITDSKGQGLDINGVQTAGTLSVRMVAAYIPKGQAQYVAYTTTVDNAFINKNPPQTQAGTDSGGTWTLVDSATGTYDYTFKTKAPATFDATVTHTIGGQAERSLTDFGITGAYTSDAVYNWVPNGSPVTVTRDVVSEKSCNQCHDPISAHGGGRKSMAYCVLCHTDQSVNPDTYNTVDMKVFIHKLHMGQNLPSVKAGVPYIIVHRQAVQDYSDIAFPQDIRNCVSCHAPGTKQADNWKTNPTRAACGSCHDNVNFQTGENHVNLPQVSDNECKNCHTPTATLDFDASIPGAHVIPNNSASLPGIIMQIQGVTNTASNNSPVVTFKVTNKKGEPVDISKLTSIRVILAGPNVDYQVGSKGVRFSENPAAVAGKDGVYTYTMTNKIPDSSTGSYTISMEARNSVTLLPGTQKQTAATDMAKPVEYYFSVDKSPVVARRKVVSSEKCAACHQNLGFVHGGTRGETQECVICHNPTLVDGTSKMSVNLAWQIHSIHRGENLANPYILGTTNYQEVKFPGDLRNCTACHLANTYQVDNVGAKADVVSTGNFTPTTKPISAACQGCHDELSTAAHALTNTSTLGESCKACHGMNSEFSVDNVHARH
ncbi:MAG: OmcA/MtrC family decaheme c-type cytochrome [Acidobacteria bacterium]|nr:OmcA/MtrC family decaheme c-type cytochrome [Acidobacteriota bacterium]